MGTFRKPKNSNEGSGANRKPLLGRRDLLKGGAVFVVASSIPDELSDMVKPVLTPAQQAARDKIVGVWLSGGAEEFATSIREGNGARILREGSDDEIGDLITQQVPLLDETELQRTIYSRERLFPNHPALQLAISSETWRDTLRSRLDKRLFIGVSGDTPQESRIKESTEFDPLFGNGIAIPTKQGLKILTAEHVLSILPPSVRDSAIRPDRKYKHLDLALIDIPKHYHQEIISSARETPFDTTLTNEQINGTLGTILAVHPRGLTQPNTKEKFYPPSPLIKMTPRLKEFLNKHDLIKSGILQVTDEKAIARDSFLMLIDPSEAEETSWKRAPVHGVSGGPVFALIHGKPRLVGVAHRKVRFLWKNTQYAGVLIHAGEDILKAFPDHIE
jgi:hypothetical protein